MEEEELLDLYMQLLISEDEHFLDIIDASLNHMKLDCRTKNERMSHLVAGFLNKIKKEQNDSKVLLLLGGLKYLLNFVSLERELALITNVILVKLIYTPDQKVYKNRSEELLLSVFDCLIACIRAVDEDDLISVYATETYKLAPTIHTCIGIAKFNETRCVRKRAIECIMHYSQVYDGCELKNTLRNAVILGFKNIVPGIVTGLFIAMRDEKCGSDLIVAGLRCWSRVVALMMLNTEKPKDVMEATLSMGKQDEFENISRNREWFSQHDDKLEVIVTNFSKFTSHDVPRVTKELVSFCENLIDSRMIPKTLSRVIQILAVLTEDRYADTSEKAKKVLLKAINRITKGDSIEYKIVLDHLQENFYKDIGDLPQIFNGLDERKQLSSMCMLVGYLKFFGANETRSVLFSQTNLDCLMKSLLDVAKLEVDGVNLLEEYSLQDLEAGVDHRTPWKVFRFRDKAIQSKLEIVCSLLGQDGIKEMIFYYLVDVYRNDSENRKEATLIINELLSRKGSSNGDLVKEMIDVYLDREFWHLPLEGDNLSTTRNNVIQICLQLEGIGKMALSIGDKFQLFLLKTLYDVLERAGSGLALLKAAGLSSITNISVACDYKSITELINKNSDYFSYHVIRKLKRGNRNESVLNVLAVVLTYSNVDVLMSISGIIEGILMDSFQRQTGKVVCPFLRVFLVFVKRIRIWFCVEAKPNPIKSAFEKEQEHVDFKVSNIEEESPSDFSDDVVRKSAEELYMEDVKRRQQEESDAQEDEGYRKKEPPLHVKLTEAILRRCVHYLPTQDATTRLLVLEILTNGVDVLAEWEDELLPIVHQIFDPLLTCFDAIETPLVINLSFQLLLALSRLSKDFIRSRTAKHVLPILGKVLKRQAKESYLKDAGSAYRYTQAFKMQEALLSQLAALVNDLDAGETSIELILVGVEPYISKRQPKSLQESAIKFYRTLNVIDEKVAAKAIAAIERRYGSNKFGEEFEANVSLILRE